MGRGGGKARRRRARAQAAPPQIRPAPPSWGGAQGTGQRGSLPAAEPPSASSLRRSPPSSEAGAQTHPPAAGPRPPRRPATPRASPPVLGLPRRIGTCSRVRCHRDASRFPGRPPRRRGKEKIAPRSLKAPAGRAERTPSAGIVCTRAAWGPQQGALAGGPVPKGRSAGHRAPGSGLRAPGPGRVPAEPDRCRGGPAVPGGQEGALKEGRRALVPAAPLGFRFGPRICRRERLGSRPRARGTWPPRRGKLRGPLVCVCPPCPERVHCLHRPIRCLALEPSP